MKLLDEGKLVKSITVMVQERSYPRAGVITVFQKSCPKEWRTVRAKAFRRVLSGRFRSRLKPTAPPPKSIFKKPFFAPKQEEAPAVASDELKELVVDSVNERVGAFTYAEDLTEPEKPAKKKFFGADKGSKIILTELIAVCVLAVAIFLTNIFMPTSAINTFIGTLTNPKGKEHRYADFALSVGICERNIRLNGSSHRRVKK